MHLEQAGAAQMRTVPSYLVEKLWALENRTWGVSLKNRAPCDTVQALLIFYSEQWFAGWKMICDGSRVVFRLCEISPQPCKPVILSKTGFLCYKTVFLKVAVETRSSPVLQYPQRMSHICNFHDTSAPPSPLFSDPVCFPFHPPPPPESPRGAPSLWPTILWPHRVQTVTPVANPSLFPSSAVLSRIFQ